MRNKNLHNRSFHKEFISGRCWRVLSIIESWRLLIYVNPTLVLFIQLRLSDSERIIPLNSWHGLSIQFGTDRFTAIIQLSSILAKDIRPLLHGCDFKRSLTSDILDYTNFFDYEFVPAPTAKYSYCWFAKTGNLSNKIQTIMKVSLNLPGLMKELEIEVLEVRAHNFSNF